jgi:sensor histidine kinase YesM
MSSYFYSKAIDTYKTTMIAQTALSGFFGNNKSLKTLFSNYILEPNNLNRQSFEGELGYEKNILDGIIKNASDNDYRARFTSLRNMLSTFEEKAQRAIRLIGTENKRQFFEATEEAIYICTLIDYSYQKYMNFFVQSQANQTEKLLTSMRINNMMSIIIITLGLFIVSFIFLFISNKITKPIILLARDASDISKYNFTIPNTKADSNDEVHYLVEAFNTMKGRILEYIDKIREQEELSQKLLLEENKNLKMANLLKEANIKSLQTQIKSHFLFNTLNLISRTAYSEGAPKTVQLIDTTTDVLKYSFNKIKATVSIFDEIAYAETYIIIQRLRFGDHISFDLTVDDDLPDILVPAWIIQPLIENAIIHGTYDKIEKSEIRVLVRTAGNRLTISVSDNGKGMGKEDLDHILFQNGDDREKSSGIGLRNVKDRLDIFSNGESEISFSSEEGKFFTVTISIDFKSQGGKP